MSLCCGLLLMHAVEISNKTLLSKSRVFHRTIFAIVLLERIQSPQITALYKYYSNILKELFQGNRFSCFSSVHRYVGTYILQYIIFFSIEPTCGKNLMIYIMHTWMVLQLTAEFKGFIREVSFLSAKVDNQSCCFCFFYISFFLPYSLNIYINIVNFNSISCK